MRKLIVFWVVSLIVIAVIASGLTTFAQTRSGGRIVSGSDIGFRVEGIDPRTGNPTGTLMVRVNGEWVETGVMPSLKAAK